MVWYLSSSNQRLGGRSSKYRIEFEPAEFEFKSLWRLFYFSNAYHLLNGHNMKVTIK